MPTGVFYDSDNAAGYADLTVAKPCEVVRIEQPLKENYGNNARLYRQRFTQLRSSFNPLALDTVCPYNAGAYLVDEGPHQDEGGGDLVSWERVWSEVPASITTYESPFHYPYQQSYTTGGGIVAIASATFARRATVTLDFFLTGSPGSISLARLPRVVVVNNAQTLFDGFTNLAAGATTIAADDELVRWMGNIWMRTHRVITI